MKPKGINFFEQHVEKIVIGVAGVIVFAIAGKAFFTDPNAVKLGTATHSPSAVDEVLAEKARTLKAKMDSPASLEIQSVGRLTDWLEAQYQGASQPARPTIALVAPTAYKLGAEGNGFISTATELYAEVKAPAPANLQAASLSYTVDPTEVEAEPDLASRFAGKPPYDLHAVHVTAEFDGTALRSALSGFVEGRKPIPTQWVDSDIAIIDVVVERQQLLADGSWASAETVGPIPGQLSVRDRLKAEGLSSRVKDELLAEAASFGSTIYQPGFYTLADGTPWSFDVVKRSVPKSPEVLDAERRMRLAWRDVEKTQAALDRFLAAQEKRKQQETTRRQDDSGGMGGGGKGGGGTEGGGAQAPAEERPTGMTTEERARQRLDDDIKKARTAYDAAKKALQDLDPAYTEFPDAVAGPGQQVGQPGGKGTQPPDSPVKGTEREHGGGMEGGGMEGGGMEGGGMEGGGGKPMPPSSGAKGGGPTAAVKGLLENPALRVWWHDITARPGSTYRYRLAVGLYNPFFGRESRLAEAQQHLAASPIVLSEWTAWSEPVRVTPPQQFFAISGIYNDQIDDRSASFEIYSFTQGVHRVVAVTCRPGEPIGEMRTIPAAEPGGAGQEVEFATGAALLDVIQIDGGSTLNQRVRVVVAMPDGSIQVLDPSDPAMEAERQRLRALATRG